MRRIETQIDIGVSEHDLWSILIALRQYELWNPLIRWAKGEPKEGTRIRMRIEPPGLSKRTVEVLVLTVKPFEEFRWLGRFLLPGLLDGEHVFMIQRKGANRVCLTQAEYFSGILVPLLAHWLVPRMQRGFHALNQALKDHAEKLHQESSAVKNAH